MGERKKLPSWSITRETDTCCKLGVSLLQDSAQSDIRTSGVPPLLHANSFLGKMGEGQEGRPDLTAEYIYSLLSGTTSHIENSRTKDTVFGTLFLPKSRLLCSPAA